MLDVVNQLAWVASYEPDRAFLVTPEGRWTYGEFDGLVNRTANALSGLGVGRGDTVGVLFGNSCGNLRTFFGGMRLGCTVVPLNFRGGPDEIARQVEHDGVDTLVVGADYHDVLETIRLEIDVDDVVVEGTTPDPTDHGLDALLDDARTEPPDTPPVPADQTAIIYHTGGTTGVPKSVPWHVGGVEAHAKKVALEIGLSADDTMLVVTPLFHIASTMMALFTVPYAGARAVLLPRFSPEPTLDAIEREEVTNTLLVPSMMRAILTRDDGTLAAYDLRSLRQISFTGEPLDPVTRRELRECFPNARSWNVFGATEVGVSLGLRPGIDYEENCVGRPFADRDVSVRDGDGEPVERGAHGELWIRGKDVPDGFFGMPEATAERYGNGPEGDWFATGDVAYADADGLYYVVGRVDDRITRGGENIQPAEIEAALLSLEGVEEAAAFGVAHDVLGETVAAALVPGDAVSLSVDDVLSHCAERLASYKQPEHVVFRESLPRTAAGKFDRRRLRDEVDSHG